MKNRNKKKKNPPPNPHATGSNSSSGGGSPTVPVNSSASAVCTPSESATLPPPPSTTRTTPTATTTTKSEGEKGEHSVSSPPVFSQPITSCSSPSSSSPVTSSAVDVSCNSAGTSKRPHGEASFLSPWVREESPFEMLELTQAQEIIDGEIRRLIHTYLHSFNLQRGTAKIHISPSSSFSSASSSALRSSSSSSFHEDDLRDDIEAEKKKEKEEEKMKDSPSVSSCCYQDRKTFLLSEVISPPYRGRRPVRSVVAPHPFPSFRASIVDGYAVQPQVYRHHHPHHLKKGSVPQSKKRDLPSSKELLNKPTVHEISHERQQPNESGGNHRDLTKKTSPSGPSKTTTGKDEEQRSPSSLHTSSQSSSSPSSISSGHHTENSIVLRIVGEVRAGSSDIKDFRHVRPRQSIEGIDSDRKSKASEMLGVNRQGGPLCEREELVKKDEAFAEGPAMRKNEKNREKKAMEKEDHRDEGDERTSVASDLPPCVYVTTGARVPNQYTAVIPVEDCKVDFDRSLCVPDERVWRSLRQGENIRPIGSDVPRGLPLVDSGQSIGPAEEGLLASFDVRSLEVYRHLNVHVLAIGDELISRSVSSSSSLDNHNRQIRQTKTEQVSGRAGRKTDHEIQCEGTTTPSSQSAPDSSCSSSSPSDGESPSRPPLESSLPSSSSPPTSQEKTRDVVYDSNTPTIGGLIAERCRGVSIGSNHLLPDEAEAVEKLLISLATGGGKEISMSSGESSSHKTGDAVSTSCLHHWSYESTPSILFKCPCQWCEEVNSSDMTGSPKEGHSASCPFSSASSSLSSSETKESCVFSNQMKKKKKPSLPLPDVLISTGGVSMGAESDCVKLALLNLERRSKVHGCMRKEETTSEREARSEKERSPALSSSCDLRDSCLGEGLFATCPSGCCRLKIEVDIHLGRLNVKPGKPAMFATVKVSSVRQDSDVVEGHRSLPNEQQDRFHQNPEKMKCTHQSALSSSSSSVSSTLLRTLLVFALPGNPCSSWVLFHLLIEPALNFFSSFLPSSSLFSYTPPHLPVVLASPVYPDSTRPEYQRALVYVTPPSSKSHDKAARAHTTYMPSPYKTLDQHVDTPQALPQHLSPSPPQVSTQISTLSCVDVVCFDGIVKKQEAKGDMAKSVTTMTCALSSVNGTWKEEKNEGETPYLTAYPTGPYQQSSRLLSCCIANSLLLIPPRGASGKDVYESGEVVEAYLLNAPYSSPPRHLLNFLRLQNQLQGQHASALSSSISSRTPQGLNSIKAAINTHGCRCGRNDDNNRSRDGVRQVIHKEEKFSYKVSNGGVAVELQKKREEDHRTTTHVIEKPTVGGMRGKAEKGMKEVAKKELSSVLHEESSVRVGGVHTPHQVDDKGMKERCGNAEDHPHSHHHHSHRTNNERSSSHAGDVMPSSDSLSDPSSLECRESLLCRLATIVVSDRCSRGEMKDECVKTVYTTLQRVPKVYNLLLPASPGCSSPNASLPRAEGNAKDWLVVPDDVPSIQKALLSFLCPCRSEDGVLETTSYPFSARRDDRRESGERSHPTSRQKVSSAFVCEDLSSSEASSHHLQRKSLIIVCGGTGLAVRDVTPQALLPFLSVRCTGLEHLILQHSLKCTPLAALGRPCVGIATCHSSTSSQAGEQSDSAYIVDHRHTSDDGSTEESSLSSDGDVTKKETLLQTGHVSPAMKRPGKVGTMKDKTSLLSEKNIADGGEGANVERGEEAVAGGGSRGPHTSIAGGCGARALVLILPGSPKAVKECLEALVDVLPHALELL